MVNRNLGFMSCEYKYTARTTDGGVNWTMTQDDSAFSYIHFADSLNGWKSYVNVEKTTDGGLTWNYQTLPNIPGASYNEKVITSIVTISKDTAFAVGGAFRPNPQSQYKCLVYKTTNGGSNWGYQIPDTNYGVLKLYYLSFVGDKNGWAFQTSEKYIFTAVGGDDTTKYTFINLNGTNNPNSFSLEQNYPNPFNQTTIINYQLTNIQNVNLIVYDITGKQIRTLTDERKPAGRYSVLFDAGGLSSGIYFYTLILGGNGNNPETKQTRKMLLVK